MNPPNPIKPNLPLNNSLAKKSTILLLVNSIAKRKTREYKNLKMDHFDETRPSFQINSFTSTTFKNSILEHTSDTSRKPATKAYKSNDTPQKELLFSSRGYSYLTPRTQLSSLSHGIGEILVLNETLNKSKDESKSIDLATAELSIEDDCKDIPTLKWCAYCSKEVCTEVFYKNSSKTFWTSVGIFFVGGVCGCFALPYVMNDCKDLAHRCFRCKRELSM